MKEAALNKINALDSEGATAVLLTCCGSRNWAELVASARPFSCAEALHNAADVSFRDLSDGDWMEAFGAHPRIGDVEGLRKKYAQNAGWSGEEQCGVDGAQELVIQELAALNQSYETRRGFIFIVCATGKSAAEMLEILRGRVENSTDEEIINAGIEQAKITHLRLEKLLL